MFGTRLSRLFFGWGLALSLFAFFLFPNPTQPLNAAPLSPTSPAANVSPPPFFPPDQPPTDTLPMEPLAPTVSGLSPSPLTLPEPPAAPPLLPAGGNYGVQSLPTLQGFATDGFSGNSTLALPLTLPPFPGNLPFGLSLSYSSEGINGLRAGTVGAERAAAFKQQGGLVGWGWTLSGLGTISREFPSDLNGDTNRLFLSFGGGSYQLVQTSAGWQTQPQSFLKIVPQGNHLDELTLWYVWAPDGTRYTFGSADWNHPAVAYHVYTGTCSNQFRQAHLTEVLDRNGNRVVVEYAREERAVPNCAQGYVRAVRPVQAVVYPVDAPSSARVRFGYQSARPDVDLPDLGDEYAQLQFSNHRLVGIAAEVRTGAGADDFSVVSRYRLVHDFDAWDGSVTSEGRPRSIMRLREVTPVGRAGGTLPGWRFDYTRLLSTSPNFTALQTYHNGQGGTVQYTYEDVTGIQVRHCGVPGDKLTSRFRVSRMVVGDGLGNHVTHRYVVLRPGQSDINSTAWAQGWGSEGLSCLQNFEFGGFNYVRHEVLDEAEVVQQVSVTEYHQATLHSDGLTYLENRQGRAWLQQLRRPDQSLLSETHTTWAIHNAANTGYMDWVYQAEQTTTTEGVGKRVVYGYDSYGNPMRVWEFLPGATTPYRTRESYYLHRNTGGSNPQAVVYLVNRLYRDRVWAGNVAWPNLATCLQDTAYAYDGQGYGVAPLRGELTLTQAAERICESGWLTNSATYDRWGNVTQQVDALGHITSIAYDTSETPPVGWWPLYTLPTLTINPQEQAVTLTWDPTIGQITQVVDGNEQTGYTYDEFGRPHKMWLPGDSEAAPTEIFWYQSYGGPTSPFLTTQAKRTNLSSDATPTYLYERLFSDGLGREVQRRVPYADTATTVRDAVSFTTYNPFGVERAFAPISQAHGTTFVSTGWDPATRANTHYKYDAMGRLFRETSPNGTLTDHRYGGIWDSALNQWVSYHNVVDANHHRRQTRTDALGRMVAVIEFTGNCSDGWTGHECDEGNPAHVPWSESARTAYQYDGADRLVGTTDALGHQTTMGYDLLGRKRTMSDPTMGKWDYRYDAAGNLRVQRDARGQTLCFAYDALNRLTGKHQHGVVADIDQTVCPGLEAFGYRYGYDGNGHTGQRTSMVDPSGTTTWRYDARGQLTEETKTILGAGSFRSQWSYDALGRVRTMRYPADNQGTLGETVSYSYATQAGQLTAVGTGYASQLRYNQHGQLLGLTLDNGVVQQYEYWPLTDPQGGGRVAHLRAGKVAPLYEELAHLGYRYDAVGNVAQRFNYRDQHPTTGFQTETFTYDERDRLLTAQVRGGLQGAYPDLTHTYDLVGNLKQKGSDSYDYGVTVAGCDAASGTKPLALETMGGASFQYDCVGNLKVRNTLKGQPTSYQYDGESRLTAMTGANFLYDGDGQRVAATQNGVTTFYVGQHIEWTNGTLTRYIYGGGGQRLAMRTGSTLYFLLADALGSTTLTLSATGTVAAQLSYDPWGASRTTFSGPTPTAFRFTGQRLDATGLYFYQSRYYDPTLGRFLQPDTIVPDPAEPQSFNRYSYVLNNPLRYTDPTGHFVEEDIPFLCPGCETWDDVKGYYGDEVYTMLIRPDISFGSVIFAGDGEATVMYTFVLAGDDERGFGLAIWDMTNNRFSDFDEVLSHKKATVWSTNTELDNGGYFYTSWDKGFLDEVSARDWAKPKFGGFRDYSIYMSGRCCGTMSRTGYRVAYDVNEGILITIAGTLMGGAPTSPAAFGALVIDVADIGADLSDTPLTHRVYPIIYTGPEWLAPSQRIRSGYLAPVGMKPWGRR